MSPANKMKYLRFALCVVGIIFILGIYTLMHTWPSGWQWQPDQYKYEQMIIGLYATLGVFLIAASKDPSANLSLIWFTVWSSVVHATIMLLQALYDPSEHGHLFGDIPALYIVALILGYLSWGLRAR